MENSIYDCGEDESRKVLSKTNKVCKLIYFTMKTIFGLFCAWWIFSIVIMVATIAGLDLFINEHPVTMAELIIFVFSCLVMAFSCGILIKIFKEASRGDTPFTIKLVSRLRLLSLALFLHFICSVMASLIISSDAGAQTFTLDLFSIVAAGVVYAFSFVFKYGVLLQEFSEDII